MAKTQLDLVTMALRKLNVVDATESPSAEDDAFADSVYETKRAELIDKGLCYWAANSIPDVVFLAMVNILAGELATAFGITVPTEMDDNGQAVAINVRGLRDLRRHMAKREADEPTKAVYF